MSAGALHRLGHDGKTQRLPLHQQSTEEEDAELGEIEELDRPVGEVDQGPRNEKRNKRCPHQRRSEVASALDSNDHNDLAASVLLGSVDRTFDRGLFAWGEGQHGLVYQLPEAPPAKPAAATGEAPAAVSPSPIAAAGATAPARPGNEDRTGPTAIGRLLGASPHDPNEPQDDERPKDHHQPIDLGIVGVLASF